MRIRTLSSAVSRGSIITTCKQYRDEGLVSIDAEISCEILQHKHPTATIHRSKIAPSESVRNSEKAVIWITSIVPEPDLLHPVFADSVSENVQLHWRFNGIKTFSSRRPYLVNPQENDPVLTWTEKTILTSEFGSKGTLESG